MANTSSGWKKEPGLIKNERDELRLAKVDLETKHKALQENAAATEEGYEQICKEKIELELQTTTLQDKLHDAISERDDLKAQVAFLSRRVHNLKMRTRKRQRYLVLSSLPARRLSSID